MNRKYDVVVVGAGVAGLYVAHRLASMKWNICLVDSKPAVKIGDKVCGDAIGIHHFEKLDLKIPGDIVDTKYRGVKIYSPSRKHSVVVPGEGLSINRVKFGQWLLKLILDNEATLLDQHVVLDVVFKDGLLRGIKVRGKNGGSFELEARVFIDASGYRPAIRSKLPREWPISDRPYQTDYNIAYREVIGVDEEIVKEEDREYALIHIDTEIAPGGYWWLFPKTPRGDIVNVGLGVVNNGRYNPRYQYEKYIKPLFPGRVIHSGGGVIPTRRPLSTLVWRNVITLGDAAYTVNPVHGGGIGSSMLSSHIASNHLDLALERDLINEENLWQINIDYMYSYGGKQAGLDILRMYMQILSNRDFEWIMENRVIDGESIRDLGVKGDLVDRVASTISTMIKLLGKPSLLSQLRIVKSYVNRARELYTTRYPRKPSDIYRWMREVDELFDEYARSINYDRGLLVKW